MADIEDVFPILTSLPVKPLLGTALIQYRMPATKVGSIIKAEVSQDADRMVEQMVRLLGVGSMFYANRTTGEPWPGDDAPQVGDYLRVSRNATDRFWWPVPGGRRVMLGLIRDVDILAIWTADPTYEEQQSSLTLNGMAGAAQAIRMGGF